MDQLNFSSQERPLTERVRPEKLLDFVGLPDKVKSQINLWIKKKWIPHLLLWGPPGSGKTSLARLLAQELQHQFFEFSASLSGVKDLKEIFEKSRTSLKPTVLFIDEIHRLNTGQQDVLLPVVERKQITLIGATTQDPNHSVTQALRSRLLSIHLKPLDRQDLLNLVFKVEKDLKILFPETLVEQLSVLCHGDARRFLNWLEIAAHQEVIPETLEEMDILKTQVEAQGVGPVSSERYDLVSAWIKSMRASKVEDALYYLASLIFIKEDPRFLTRRLMIFAAEDCESPELLKLAASVDQMAQTLGFPEIRIPLSKVTLAFARAKKGREGISAIDEKIKQVELEGLKPVPFHLRNQYHESEL